MYILIPLPYSGLMASGYAGLHFKHKLKDWSKQYGIEYTIVHEQVRKHIIVQFPNEADYTLFALTWQPTTHTTKWTNMRICEGEPPASVITRKGS